MSPERDRVGADPAMRWNGWGDPAKAKDLPLAVRALLPMLLGRIRRPEAPPELADVELNPPMLSAQDLDAFRAAVGADQVDVSQEARIRHAGGRSTPDLLRRRERVQSAPDAVIRPASHEEVVTILRVAGERSVAVIPFGGGTSVVGALDPERGSHRAVVSLDLRRLSGLLALDEVSGEAAPLRAEICPPTYGNCAPEYSTVLDGPLVFAAVAAKPDERRRSRDRQPAPVDPRVVEFDRFDDRMRATGAAPVVAEQLGADQRRQNSGRCRCSRVSRAKREHAGFAFGARFGDRGSPPVRNFLGPVPFQSAHP